MSRPELFADPALSLAIALAAGMLAQVVARHLGIPGIVVLLATGVLLGPELAGVVQPASLGEALHVLVGFAVAIILFEGGLNLNRRQLAQGARSIRQLVTVGAVVTAVGGALATRWLLDWEWQRAAPFGALVIVTGPTVITPLLRRIRLRRRVATVLEAEGVFGDAIGAIAAVVTLEVVLYPSSVTAFGLGDLVGRLGFGVLTGVLGGLLLASLLRVRGLVPEGLENVLILAFVVVLFAASNAVLEESGLVTVIVAGMAVANLRTGPLRELREFKEQLTVLMIGMLFVLLAADVRFVDVQALGWRGLLTVLALMLVVRPLNVLAGTAGSELGTREKLFMCWLAPRGIVAAAVASLFAQKLEAAGYPGGNELRALVFSVIAITVLVQGLSGRLVAQLLGLLLPPRSGFTLLGAGPLGLALGRLLRDGGREVAFVDSNTSAYEAARAEGFETRWGNALSDGVLSRLGLLERTGTVAVTSNEEVNFLFSQRARDEFKVPKGWVALGRSTTGVTEPMVQQEHLRILFAARRSLALWSAWLGEDRAQVAWWEQTGRDDRQPGAFAELAKAEYERSLLPLVVRRGDTANLVDEETTAKKGDRLAVALHPDRREAGESWLREAGWEPRGAGPGG